MRICGADLNGDNLRISRAYLRFGDHCRVTVRIRIRFGSGFGSGSGLELRLGLGLGLQIVVYKLLEKATKCGSITWLKLTNGDVPRRSTPLRISSCPMKNYGYSSVELNAAVSEFCKRLCFLHCFRMRIWWLLCVKSCCCLYVLFMIVRWYLHYLLTMPKSAVYYLCQGVFLYLYFTTSGRQ